MKVVSIRMSDEAVSTALAEAKRCGVTCLGTKVGFDVEQYYLRLSRRRKTSDKNEEVSHEG